MTSALTTVLVAVSAASAVCYLLMTRMENRRIRRASPGGGTGSGNGGCTSGCDGWSLGSLFGYTSTSEVGQATDSCGGWDSGGGDSDCGGGDGGGGGD